MSKRPPTSVEVLPSGIEIKYWDSVGIEDQLPQQRRYMVDGQRMASVSTISKVLDTDPTGLLHWSAGLTCEGVAQLAAQNGSIDWINSGQSIKAALREAELTWTDVRDQAAKRGTNVHELIFAALAERRKLPDLADLSEEERGYGRAAMRFWADRDPKPLHAEQMAASVAHGYAGRFDLLAEIDGVTCLIDAKTRGRGQDRISDHVQLAGYSVAIAESGLGEVEKTVALILTPEGEYLEVEGQATEEDWMAALNSYKANKSLSKRMREARKAVAA
jgi:hypothetical protein